MQLALASIPGIVYGDWSILLTTGCGTILALGTGALPEWRKEKWSGHPRLKDDTSKTICLTAGNGSNHVIVITSDGPDDLDLEALASARFDAGHYTKGVTIFFAVCWVCLLFTIAGIKENSWFLLMIGALGMLQNIAAAGLHRNTSSLGIHLKPDTRGGPDGYIYPSGGEKTMAILKQVEECLPGVGASLLDLFFQKGLRPDEEVWWKGAAETRKARKARKKMEMENKPSANSPEDTGKIVGIETVT
jgi:hypothetical protein